MKDLEEVKYVVNILESATSPARTLLHLLHSYNLILQLAATSSQFSAELSTLSSLLTLFLLLAERKRRTREATQP